MKTLSILPLAICLAFTSAACQKKQKTEDDKTETKTEATSEASGMSAAAAASSAAAKSGKPQIPAPDNVAAPPPEAEKTASGLASIVLTPGTGDTKPTEWDKVKVHYTGWMADGTSFDSTQPKNRPATFGVKGVIKGWTEGLQMMVAGEKRRFWIPADLAYGDKPRRPGAPSGQLTFDVELLEVIAGPKPPEVPEDVAAPPATARKTKSGLAYRVLTKGTGKVHPKETDRVQVHYSGWTTDGKMFDSSIMRNRPASFSLNGVIKGWTEGVQLMVVGEKTRFWIPADLAYGETPRRPGAPSGQLTFDIELLDIQKAGARPNPHGAVLSSKGKPTTKPGASAKPASPKPAAAPKPATQPATSAQ